MLAGAHVDLDLDAKRDSRAVEAAITTRLLNDCCDWSDVTEVTCFDHDTGRSFAVSLDLLRSWQGVSFYAKDHWDIPSSAKLRYQITLRTPDTWYSVHVLVGVLVDSNFA